MRTLLLAALLGLAAAGCASVDPDVTRGTWDVHDREAARQCRGRALSGVCLGGGGP